MKFKKILPSGILAFGLLLASTGAAEASVEPPGPPWQCTRGEFVEDHGNGPLRYRYLGYRESGYRTYHVYNAKYEWWTIGEPKDYTVEKDCTYD